MADYKISGFAPSKTGGSWDGGSSWFLFDGSGRFSVDKDLTCTIYLVGGGCNGGAGSAYKGDYARGGKGGDGGYVYIAQHVTIPKNTDCIVLIAGIGYKTGTALSISEKKLKCNNTGCSSTVGGQGGYIYYDTTLQRSIIGNNAGEGCFGVLTPYGVVGSSGGGGGTGFSSSYVNAMLGGTGAGTGGLRLFSNKYQGDGATNYGCGGGGGGGGSVYSDSSTFNSGSGGSGKSGCVIICVEGDEGTDDDSKKYPLPYLEKTEFEYNGKEQYADGDNLKNFNSTVMEVSGTVSATYVSMNEDGGTYKLRVSFKQGNNCEWVDKNGNVYTPTDKDGNAVDYIELPWKITPIKVFIPFQNNYSVYCKESQSPAFANYDRNVMTLLGGTPSRTDAATYYVTFRLKDGYTWSDGTTGDKRVEWRIEPQKVSFPYTLTDGTGTYYYEIDGKRYPIWGNYDPDLIRMSGDTYGGDSSWSISNFELKDKKNYVWEQNSDTSGEHSISWKPSKAYTKTPTTGGRNKVHIPRQSNRPIEDGATKYPEWDKYDNTVIINRGGEWEGVTAGERYVILELQDGYIWEDDTDEIKAVPWKIYETGTSDSDIEPIPIRIPKQINPPYYDGYVKEPEWDSWDDYGFDIIGGVLMEVPAGEYRIKLRLKSGYIWEDGSTEDKIVTWVINPRKIEDIPDADIPRDPAPEREGDGDGNGDKNNGTGCGCCCCCDTGLFDILKNACSEDDEHCDCT